jgi:predicted DNA-binding protein (MmcQ/YjbR family)
VATLEAAKGATWVSVNAPKGKVPVAMFEEWIDESYANVAPRRKRTVS